MSYERLNQPEGKMDRNTFNAILELGACALLGFLIMHMVFLYDRIPTPRMLLMLFGAVCVASAARSLTRSRDVLSQRLASDSMLIAVGGLSRTVIQFFVV